MQIVPYRIIYLKKSHLQFHDASKYLNTIDNNFMYNTNAYFILNVYDRGTPRLNLHRDYI